MQCDAILQPGIFNTLVVDTNKELADNLYNWLSTASYSDVQSKLAGGLKIGLPIKGVPLNISGSISRQQFNQWKTQLNQGNARRFTERETMKIVSSSVDQGIVNAWLECIKATSGLGQTGLVAWIDGPSDGETVIFRVRYLPASINDLPPVVSASGFQLSGGTTNYALAPDQEIPLGGVSVLIHRTGDAPVVVVLNTTKGSVTVTAPPPPIRQSDLRLVVEAEVLQPFGAHKNISLRLQGRPRAMESIQRVDYTVTGDCFTGGCAFGTGTFSRTFSSSSSSTGFKVSYDEIHWAVNVVAVVTSTTGQSWEYAWSVTHHE